ncbi:MAG: hypothetical protein EBR09_16040 [Proteobacteria bacterium]|jgi:hypothetical protein|nr:hypothetical protein [Pseudomonadota bacterium]
MYGGSSASRNVTIKNVGDATVKFIRYDKENGVDIKVFEVCKDGRRIGEATQNTLGEFVMLRNYHQYLVHACETRGRGQ